jgi:hypothetical protein
MHLLRSVHTDVLAHPAFYPMALHPAVKLTTYFYPVRSLRMPELQHHAPYTCQWRDVYLITGTT